IPLATAGMNLLEQNLKPAQAHYDSFSREAVVDYLERTRVAILQNIRKWIFNTEMTELQIFSLYTLAGMGKSTIAQTIAG
ncbi:hypothetical protein FRB96_009626, partial [Tulasnella sp. 330]